MIVWAEDLELLITNHFPLIIAISPKKWLLPFLVFESLGYRLEGWDFKLPLPEICWDFNLSYAPALGK